MRRPPSTVTVVAAALLAWAVPACGGDGDVGAPPEATSGETDAAAGDPSTDKLAQVLARGTLIGFFEEDYPPQSIAVEGAQRPADTKCAENQLTGAEVTGYDNEVTKLVAERLGVEACFVSPPWAELTAGNWGDRWDLAFGSGSITEDRMERLYVTQPYYATPNRYFVRADSPTRTPSELNGKRIGACTGCTHELYLKGQLEIPGAEVVLDVKDPQIVTFEVEGPGLAAAAAGKIDAMLAADPVGRARIDEGLKLRPLEAISFSDYLAGYVDKSSGLNVNAFVARVNEILQGLHADGTLKRLATEWFDQDYASAAAEFDVATLGQTVQ